MGQSCRILSKFTNPDFARGPEKNYRKFQSLYLVSKLRLEFGTSRVRSKIFIYSLTRFGFKFLKKVFVPWCQLLRLHIPAVREQESSFVKLKLSKYQLHLNVMSLHKSHYKISLCMTRGRRVYVLKLQNIHNCMKVTIVFKDLRSN